GTDFYEWVDHFTLNPEHGEELRAAGLVPEAVETAVEGEVYYHPRAMMPRVILQRGGSLNAVPLNLAIRVESLVDFVTRQNLSTEICGSFGAGFRQAVVAVEEHHTLFAVERLGYRGFLVHKVTPEQVEAVIKVRELWRTRKRNFPNDAEGVAHALDIQKEGLDLDE